MFTIRYTAMIKIFCACLCVRVLEKEWERGDGFLQSITILYDSENSQNHKNVNGIRNPLYKEVFGTHKTNLAHSNLLIEHYPDTDAPVLIYTESARSPVTILTAQSLNTRKLLCVGWVNLLWPVLETSISRLSTQHDNNRQKQLT